MIKREFKINLKGFIIWTAVLVGLFLSIFLMYPFLITEETMQGIDELMKMFPEEMLKAFNMDMSSIATAYGWLISEGFTYVLLIVGIYASLLGGGIVLKEESNKTIEYLACLPVTRKKIITNKIIVGFTYIIGMVLLLTIFNFFGLLISGDFDKKQFILLSITPIFVGLPLFALCLFISLFLHKTGQIIGISLGITLAFYLLSILSELSSNVEFLKYFSLYTLADVRNVITDVKLNIWIILISLVITGGLVALSYVIYDKKELL